MATLFTSEKLGNMAGTTLLIYKRTRGAAEQCASGSSSEPNF